MIIAPDEQGSDSGKDRDSDFEPLAESAVFRKPNAVWSIEQEDLLVSLFGKHDHWSMSVIRQVSSYYSYCCTLKIIIINKFSLKNEM
jgi:hypothetical protein